jgi:hypothetical protein
MRQTPYPGPYHTLKRTELYPDDATPLALSVRSSQAKVSN